MSEWIGVDLDGTLAHYEGWKGVEDIGDPVPAMVSRVKQWLADGKEVRIFTARMHGHGAPIPGGGHVDALTPIQNWSEKHIGQTLKVTNIKDFGMVELWDDRAIQVVKNTGEQIKRRNFFPDRDLPPIKVSVAPKTPHRCPVCFGSGKIIRTLGTWTTGTNSDPCHGCIGSGIVWG